MERDGRKEKAKDSSSRSRSKAKDDQKEVPSLPKTVHVPKSKERDQKKDKKDKKDDQRKAKNQPESGYESESGRSESDYDEEDHSPGSCRSDSEESGSEYDEDAPNSPAASMRKTELKEVKKETKKTSSKRKAEDNEEEPKRSKHSKKGEADVKETQGFGDMEVDLDLYHSAPSNVVPMRIKLANNLILTCKNLDQKDTKIAYDYAALTFQRRTGQDKIFEFNLPMSITPRLMSALKAICTKNHKFFKPDGLDDVVFSGNI